MVRRHDSVLIREKTIAIRKPFNKRQSQTRVNDRIRVSPVRVVDAEGTMLGEMPTDKALEMAKTAGLDLVEVSGGSTPPVCRIMDFGKANYQRRKKQNSKSASRTQLKQIRLRAKTDQHDIEFKVRKARDFLSKRHKVKVNVFFRGRENAHHERGREMLTQIAGDLEDIATSETAPIMESRRMMSMMLTPRSKTS